MPNIISKIISWLQSYSDGRKFRFIATTESYHRYERESFDIMFFESKNGSRKIKTNPKHNRYVYTNNTPLHRATIIWLNGGPLPDDAIDILITKLQK